MPRPLAALALAALVAATPAAAQSVDEILERHYAAVGGRERIAAVRSAKITGKQLAGSQEVPVTLYWKQPGKLRAEFIFQGTTGVNAFDGARGWTVMPFLGQTEPVAMGEEDLRDVAEQTDVIEGPLFDWRRKGHTVTLVGRETVAGTDAWKLELERKSGDVLSIWLDAQSMLEIRRQGVRKRGEEELPYEAITGDYRDVGGLRFAFRVETRAQGAPVAAIFAIESVELDLELPDSLFEMPAAAPAAAAPAAAAPLPAAPPEPGAPAPAAPPADDDPARRR